MAAIFVQSIACAWATIFLAPCRNVAVSEKLIEKAKEEEPGML